MIFCVIVAFCLTACASGPETNKGKGTAYGAAGGAAVGAVLGQVLGKDTESTLTGAAIGAAVGAATGAGVGHMMDQQEAEIKEVLSDSETATTATVERDGDLLAISLQGDVAFASGSAKVRPELHSAINRIADIMNKYPETSIVVEGHTDDRGKEASNMKLSERRAEAVKGMLVKRGVENSRIQILAFGEAMPVADNSTAEGRQMNRRVEIKIAPTSG